MKAVIGLLLIFTGLTTGYLVLAGKLPTNQANTAPTKTGGGLPIASEKPSRDFTMHDMPISRGYAV